jgi:hypothetical protein
MLNFRREGTIEVAPGGGLIPSRVEAKSTGACILQSVSAIPGSPVTVGGQLGHQGRATKRKKCTFDAILIPHLNSDRRPRESGGQQPKAASPVDIDKIAVSMSKLSPSQALDVSLLHGSCTASCTTLAR